jgi:malate dehydrogenase
MTTVAVIGAGEIGGAAAWALAAGAAVSRIVLIDAAAGVAAGKALDIQQAGAISGLHARLDGTAEIARAAGCTVCVLADRAPHGGEWTGDEGLALLTRLLPAIGQAPIVFAGTSQTSLPVMAVRELGVARRRLIGSASEAFAAAVRAMTALEAHCSPAEVSLGVLGRPPNGLIVPWDDASIAGRRVDERIDSARLRRLEARVERVWPPGPHALGQAAASVVAAICGSGRRAFSVSTVLDGEFGVRQDTGIVAAMLGPGGIVSMRLPTLTTRDRVKLMSALQEQARVGSR